MKAEEPESMYKDSGYFGRGLHQAAQPQGVDNPLLVCPEVQSQRHKSPSDQELRGPKHGTVTATCHMLFKLKQQKTWNKLKKPQESPSFSHDEYTDAFFWNF